MKNPKINPPPTNKSTSYTLKVITKNPDGTGKEMYVTDNNGYGVILLLSLVLLWLLSKLMKSSSHEQRTSRTSSTMPINYTYTYNSTR